MLTKGQKCWLSEFGIASTGLYAIQYTEGDPFDPEGSVEAIEISDFEGGGGSGVPNAPTGLSTSYTCGNSIELTWNTEVGVTYEIREGTNVLGSTSNGTYTISGSNIGQHTFSVYAKSGIVYSAGTSITVSVLNCFVPPTVTPVTNVTGQATGTDIVLAWSPIASGHLYEVREGSTVIATNLGSSPYVVVSPSIGTHTYTVYPYIGSTYGTPASTTVTIGAAPASVTGLTTTYTTGCLIPISWNTVAGATGYKIYLSGVFKDQITGTSTTLTASGDGVAAVQVVAYNINGNAVGTNLNVTVTGCSAVGAPPAVVGLTYSSTDGSCGQPVLTWTASAGATGYKIWMDGGLITTTGAVTTYTFSGVTSGSHFFEISAINGSGESAKRNLYGNVVICTGTVQDIYVVPNDIVIECGVNSNFFITSTQTGIKHISYNVQWEAGCGIATHPIIGGIVGGTTGEGRTVQSLVSSSDQYTFNTTAIVNPGTVVGVFICATNGGLAPCTSLLLKAGSTFTLS